MRLIGVCLVWPSYTEIQQIIAQNYIEITTEPKMCEL